MFNMAASKKSGSIRRLEQEVQRLSHQQTKAMRMVMFGGMTVREVKEYGARHRRLIHLLKQMATHDGEGPCAAKYGITSHSRGRK